MFKPGKSALRALNLETREVPTSPASKKRKRNSTDHASVPDDTMELDTSQTDRENSVLRNSPRHLRGVNELEIDESKTIFSDEEGEEQLEEGPILDPTEMKEHVMKFYKLVEKKNSMDKAVSHQLKKQISEYIKANEPDFTEEQFFRSYRFYMKKASSCRTFHTDQTMISAVLERPSTVELYPDYPQIPHSALHLYAQKHGMPLAFGKVAEVKKRMEIDFDGRQTVDAQFREMEEALVDKLTVFAAAHETVLNTHQKQFVQKKIASLNKKLNPEIVVTKPVRGRSQKSQPPETPKSKKPSTVFEMFLNAKKELYIDMDPEKRERKLQRKFEKLTAEERQVWESVFFSL